MKQINISQAFVTWAIEHVSNKFDLPTTREMKPHDTRSMQNIHMDVAAEKTSQHNNSRIRWMKNNPEQKEI